MKKALAFDIGGTKIYSTVVDETGKVVSEIDKFSTPKNLDDIKSLLKTQIAKYENTKLTIDNQLVKLYELLSEMDAAEEFISNSDETIQSLLTNPIKWRNYKELNYVNKMESFF